MHMHRNTLTIYMYIMNRSNTNNEKKTLYFHSTRTKVITYAEKINQKGIKIIISNASFLIKNTGIMVA